MRPAILAGAMKLPVEEVNCKQIESQCTYEYLPMGAPEVLRVESFFYEGDFICVPRQYGLSLCNRLHIPWEDHTSLGSAVKFPKVPTPREYQASILDRIVTTFDTYYDFIFRAHTGWGKTIGSLVVAARLGVTTIIIVDQENLRDQWIEVLTDPKLFGFKADDIGIVQGKKCSYQGKAVTIAMVQTLTQKDYPEEFYESFGCMVCDEVHTVGAPTFSTVLVLFPAAYRLGVSATPKRKDGLQKALDHNLGKVRVAADKKHAESSVYIIYHDTLYSWYANISPKVGRILTEVSEDGLRNLKLAEAAQWLYETGRDVILMGDRIGQLKELSCLLKYMGVEESDIGLYTGYDPKLMLAKDPRPARRPHGYERGTEYTPVKLQIVEKKIPKKRLLEVKERARIVLATYGMFAKGMDVPRLAGGVDATPRSTSEQQQGRIQRELKGKQMPIWVTIVDRNNYRLLHSFLGRASEYVKNNSRLYEWGDDGELTECEPKEFFAQAKKQIAWLKTHRIETNADGLNTLVMEPTENDKRQKQENDIRAWAAEQAAKRKQSPRPSRAGAKGVKSPTRDAPNRSPQKPTPSRRPLRPLVRR